MSSVHKLIAEVPTHCQQEGIRWLILEEDEADTKGWFLFGHRDLDRGSVFDSWHTKIEEAQREAEAHWGVAVNDWKEYT